MNHKDKVMMEQMGEDLAIRTIETLLNCSESGLESFFTIGGVVKVALVSYIRMVRSLPDNDRDTVKNHLIGFINERFEDLVNEEQETSL